MMKNKVFRIINVILFFVVISISARATDKLSSLYDLPVKFKTSQDEDVTLSKWKGTPMVITMTYTSCEYACPRIIERLKNVQRFFNSKKRSAKFIVATFDPVRDTHKRLKSHQESIGDAVKDWTFITGSEPNLRQLSMILGIRFEKNPEDGNISHDNKILITNDKGEIIQELNGLSPDVSEIR